jgi:hypothetical protein
MFWGKSVKFDPDQDIGDLDGKVIVVTGGECTIARHPFHQTNMAFNIVLQPMMA